MQSAVIQSNLLRRRKKKFNIRAVRWVFVIQAGRQAGRPEGRGICLAELLLLLASCLDYFLPEVKKFIQAQFLND